MTSVWITGGASGIGRATALLLARDGAHVTVSDRDEDGLESLAAEAHVPIEPRGCVDALAAVARLRQRASDQPDLEYHYAGMRPAG